MIMNEVPKKVKKKSYQKNYFFIVLISKLYIIYI